MRGLQTRWNSSQYPQYPRIRTTTSLIVGSRALLSTLLSSCVSRKYPFIKTYDNVRLDGSGEGYVRCQYSKRQSRLVYPCTSRKLCAIVENDDLIVLLPLVFQGFTVYQLPSPFKRVHAATTTAVTKAVDLTAEQMSG